MKPLAEIRLEGCCGGGSRRAFAFAQSLLTTNGSGFQHVVPSVGSLEFVVSLEFGGGPFSFAREASALSGTCYCVSPFDGESGRGGLAQIAAQFGGKRTCHRNSMNAIAANWAVWQLAKVVNNHADRIGDADQYERSTVREYAYCA